MRRRLLCALLGAGLAACPAVAIDVFVRQPLPSKAVFGEVVVEVEVLSARDVAAVEVHLDGELAGRLSAPPWRLVVDVGDENRAHVFDITATDVAGESASRRIETPALATGMQVDLELQQLYVTVTRGGQRVLDLPEEQFEILDDGEPQEIVTFESGDVPFSAVLLIDTSFSMRGEHLRASLAGVQAFLQDMRPLDLAKVVLFSDQTLITTPFTGDPQQVAAAVAAARADGGTAINDHLYLALKALESHQGRRVVILLSDGVDVESALHMADVRWKAGRSSALIYWIRPSAAALERFNYYSAWRNPDEHRQEIDALVQAVSDSGGRIHDIERLEDAPRAFREILAELREQYVFGYYPKENRNDGAWHEVRVRVRASGTRVRARGGYYDDRLQ